jgi:hypothetical protein
MQELMQDIDADTTAVTVPDNLRAEIEWRPDHYPRQSWIEALDDFANDATSKTVV